MVLLGISIRSKTIINDIEYFKKKYIVFTISRLHLWFST